MAIFLYRVGQASFRSPWRVAIAWLLIAGAIIGIGFGLGGKTKESFAIPGTESQQAIDHLAAVFPQTAGASVQVVYKVPSGTVDDAKYKDAILAMAAQLGALDGIAAVTDPFSQYAGNAVNPARTVAISQVQFAAQSSEISPAALDRVTATAAAARATGMQVEFGGQVFQDNTFGITVTEALGVLFAGVVLIITFGSLLAAGLPLLSALIGVGVAIGGISLVSAFASVSSTAPLLALMIGLAVGIDYSLFILSRHRTQLANGMDVEESAATAVATSGGAVVFAGLTVIIALLGLLVVGIPFLSVMGVAAAFAVLVAVGIAITLLPALLALAGARLQPKPGSRAARRALAAAAADALPADGLPRDELNRDALNRDALNRDALNRDPSAENRGSDRQTLRPSLGMRWVRLVLRAPLVAALVVVGLLGALLVPALQLQLSLPDNGREAPASTQRKAFDLISEGFGPGRNGPLIVVVDITQTTRIQQDLAAIGDRLRALDDVSYVGQGLPNPGVDTAIISVIPSSAPDAPATTALVQRIRDLGPELAAQYGTPIAVTGSTAVMIDISSTLGRALLPFGAIVVGLSVLLLMMVFRSLFVPLSAALGFLLSVVGAFGVVVAVFQNGLFADVLGVQPGPILSFLPVLLMAVLFGLAMDYQVFLVSGMREEFVHTGNVRRAITVGFAHAARVVTAAALIMFFVFFAFVPEGSGTIKPIALALATGVLFDAFLVRMTLIPALMALAGRAAWYLPRWLGRLLPNVDIEGEGLGAHRRAEQWASAQNAAVSAEQLLLPGAESELTLRIPDGSVAVLRGPAPARTALFAAIAGYGAGGSGRLSVLGRPLPTAAAQVRRLVATADLAELAGTDVTVGDLVVQRLRLLAPWQLPWRRNAAGRRLIAAVTEQPGAATLTADTLAAALGPVPRATLAVALAAVAGTPVLILDLADDGLLDAAVTAAVAFSAPATTILVGTADAAPGAAVVPAGRRILILELARKAALA